MELSDFIETNYESCYGWGCTASSLMRRYISWCTKLGIAPIGGRNTVYESLRDQGMLVAKGTGGQIRVYGLKEKELSSSIM